MWFMQRSFSIGTVASDQSGSSAMTLRIVEGSLLIDGCLLEAPCLTTLDRISVTTMVAQLLKT